MLKCSMHCTHLLTCPFCGTHLTQIDNTLTCTNSHTFDIAKEGYVNLLRKKLPGDTKEMLIARRNFLEQGYYQPLSDTINALVSTALGPETPSSTLLDAGCGEGYYLGRLQAHLANQMSGTQCCYTGLDISKEAIRMAAKKYKTAQF